MNKTAIKNFSVWAREKLIEDIVYQAGLLGVTETGAAEPLPQSTGDLQFFDIGTKEYAQVSGAQIKQRNDFVYAIKRKAQESNFKSAFQYVVEEVAYTWFNRLIAIRFMEVNDYLPSRIRVLSSENPAKNEPDFVTSPFDTNLPFTDEERATILKLKEANRGDELFRLLFIKQCNALTEILPELFERTEDYTELLLTISYTDPDGVVYHLVHDIDERDFNISTLDENGEPTGQVQIIGWLYQYYNSVPKDRVFAALKKNVKITKENIPAATQLFTPDWIVRYMVENSLGRIYVDKRKNEGVFVDGRGADEMTCAEMEAKRISNEKYIAEQMGWKYFLPEAEQTSEVQEQLDKLQAEYANKDITEIKVIDPCMGSGHILVYAFDVLMQIYESQGYTQRDAAQSIVQNNLFGLEIDKRAYQLAYFAVMMKARQYDRRFLERWIRPQLYYPGSYADGQEYGSLLIVDELEPEPEEKIYLIGEDSYETRMERWNFRRLLAQKYDVVCTNPPYMGSSGMNAKLAEYVKLNYPDSKSDLSTAFMERTLCLCSEHGYMSMINIPVWMFLSSYEELRKKMIVQNTFTSMVHPGRGIFGSDFGTTTFIIEKTHIAGYIGSYRRLFNKQGEVESIEERERAFLSGKGAFTARQDDFSKIPGSPVAYWWGNFNIFELNTISDYYESAGRNKTHNNELYVQNWWEIEDAVRWQPYANGGVFRRWAGNDLDVVDWSEEARTFYASHGGLYNQKYNGKRGICWNLITSYKNGFRLKHEQHHYSSGSPTIISTGKNHDLLVLAYLNSVVATALLNIYNPTLNTTVGDVLGLPISFEREEEIVKIAQNNLLLSQADWDSFETSWDFTCHPLVRGASTVAEAYAAWEAECEARFTQLKANEEELNRIFIDIYGLQDELTPEVEDKDVTLHRIYDTKDDVPESMKGSAYARTKRDEVVSLISYAVGCMFGRYSLYKEGLIYAGGEWDYNKFENLAWLAEGKPDTMEFYKAGTHFFPDQDNAIPICDDEYFRDDIVGRFVEFINIVYGRDTLEENLKFIADALGNKGNTSLEVIRNYFLNDFMKDHVKTYQKRPIYWLFDSGKENGFKALVYMHRWNADTIGNLRVEYLHRTQQIYEREIQRMQDTIDNSTNAREVTVAEKRKDKLMKQLKECRDYDAKIAHLALSRIDIDLDDGVKVNYEKVQTGQDGKVLEVLYKLK